MPDTVSIVVPCFNEAEVIGLFHRALTAELDAIADCRFEILYVDDGSKDQTLVALNAIAAQDPRVSVLSFSRNFGHQIALSAGIDFATGDAVITMDSDLQHPPALIPTFLREWRAGNDIVSGVRDDTAGVSFFKKLSSRLFYRLINALSTVEIPTGAADFGLLSRRVADALRHMPERHRFLRGLVAWAGFRRALVHYTSPARAAGTSKYTMLKMIALALDAVVSFSTVPLRLATRAGFAITFFGFAYFAWNVVHALATKSFAPGWASLIAVTMILGGSQLLFIGIIGQYVARMFDELKGRPLYVLKQAPPTSSPPS
jgi:dolichol-phosphate mannosyltransferase